MKKKIAVSIRSGWISGMGGGERHDTNLCHWLLGAVLCELLNDTFEQAAKLFSCFGFHGKTSWMWVTKSMSIQKKTLWYMMRHLCGSENYQYPANLFVLFSVCMHSGGYKYGWLSTVHKW